MGYLYLFNFTIPVAFLFMQPTVLLRLVGGGLIALFAGVYILSFWSRGRQTLLWITIEIVLMVLMIALLGPGYVWMIFYPAAQMGIYVSQVPHLIRSLASMVLLFVVETYAWGYFGGQNLSIYWILVAAASLGGVATAFATRTQQKVFLANRALTRANEQIARLTKSAERERISQDLHDVMGHELSMIALKAQLAVKLIDRDAVQAKLELRDIEKGARQALARVREYIADIKQPQFEEEWQQALHILHTAGVDCIQETPSDQLATILMHPENDRIGGVFAMCLREIVTNIVRHSGANQALLRLEQDDQEVRLLIADNGQGLRSKDAPGQPSTQAGNGLNGVRARVATLDGNLLIWSNRVPDAADEHPHNARDCPTPWLHGTTLLLTAPI
ncbi:MAG: hypothetical protein A2201_14030 [Alicyclobacillus sp. RIFOXYA1_FULL_53_8]|nr:MAG: hypothetical protein A2201_14030 [Alicyclobacillus sp. RIFOXYA1_FULL_53_8]